MITDDCKWYYSLSMYSEHLEQLSNCYSIRLFDDMFKDYNQHQGCAVREREERHVSILSVLNCIGCAYTLSLLIQVICYYLFIL